MLLKLLLPLIILSGCGKTSSSRKPSFQEVSDDMPSPVSCHQDSRVLPSYKNTKNYLSFENFGTRGFGRCRGHALVSQTMEMLAKFAPHRPHPCFGKDQTTCYSTMYRLITEILGGNIRIIGGFDSLYEFSKDPDAESILRLKIGSISHRYFASESPLEVNGHGSKNVNVYYDVIRRLKLRHRPYVGILGKYRIGNHAVIAYQVKKDRICVRDPNIVIHGRPFEDCQNYFYLNNGEIFFHQINQEVDEELLTATLQTDEDDRVRNYIQAHYKSCQSGHK
jgi:hypothetical protein